MAPKVNNATAFCIGYGMTMLFVLIGVGLHERRKKAQKDARDRESRKLSYLPSSSHERMLGLSSLAAPSPNMSGIGMLNHLDSTRSNNTINTGSPRMFHVTSEMGTLERPTGKMSRRLGHWSMNRKLVLIMVGLPARGKSYIVKMVTRYLNWIDFPTKVFNIGDYRRKLGFAGVDKSFFDADNEEGMRIRSKMLEVVQDEMYQWLAEDENKVALLDATNTTKERRAILLNRSREEKNTMLVFIESICDDPDILVQNYRMKLQNDDYKNQSPTEALKDFKERIKAYESVYDTIEDSEDKSNISYIKLYNVGQKVVTRNCKGYLPSQVAFYLQNIHIGQRKIWLTKPAESIASEQGQGELSNSGELTEAGRKYSMLLAKYIRLEQENLSFTGPGTEVIVMAGTQGVDAETIAHLQMLYPVASTTLLNELGSGSFSSMSRETFKQHYPDMYAQREADKLEFRFPGPGGESYMDVIQRVRPIIVELERQQRSCVVVCHMAVQRCLYAYFTGVPISEVPFIDLPLHTVTELSPTPFGTKVNHLTEEALQHCF